jgi:hypothetical protein
VVSGEALGVDDASVVDEVSAGAGSVVVASEIAELVAVVSGMSDGLAVWGRGAEKLPPCELRSAESWCRR